MKFLFNYLLSNQEFHLTSLKRQEQFLPIENSLNGRDIKNYHPGGEDEIPF